MNVFNNKFFLDFTKDLVFYKARSYGGLFTNRRHHLQK